MQYWADIILETVKFKYRPCKYRALMASRFGCDNSPLYDLPSSLKTRTHPVEHSVVVVVVHPTAYSKSEPDAPHQVSQRSGTSYGNRGFRKGAATLWNNLSVTARKCKSLHAFKRFFFEFFSPKRLPEECCR